MGQTPLLRALMGWKKTNIAQYCTICYKLLTILLNITNINQYFQYNSILPNITRGPILPNITQFTCNNCSWTLLSCSWILLKCYQYYPILPILPIPHNITNITKQIFTNIHQYYTSNITQYFIVCIQYQYYSILPILPNITQYS